MNLLDVHSLISISRVSRRFHHLHGDEFIWSDVDLTDKSLGARLDARKLKKIIHTYLPSSLWRIKLSSNSQSISSKNPVVTEALLNDLFIRCPTIRIIVLHRCDLTNVRPSYFSFFPLRPFLFVRPHKSYHIASVMPTSCM